MKKFLVLAHHLYEDLELWYPAIRIQEAGYQVVIAGPKSGETVEGKHSYPCRCDISFGEARAEDFAGILIPGGYAPDKLRRVSKVLELVSSIYEAKKPVAFICHAAWVPISAKIVKGKRVTGSPALKDDLENAGAIWKDEPLVIDGQLISSRKPEDLPLFGKAIVDHLGEQQ